jgi:hypothetical protein
MLMAELERADEALARAAAAGVDVGQSGERMRARLAALREAPAGAGWNWLAARGDAGAAAAAKYEHQRGSR